MAISVTAQQLTDQKDAHAINVISDMAPDIEKKGLDGEPDLRKNLSLHGTMITDWPQSPSSNSTASRSFTS
jgi:hypothetical protein